MPISATRDYDPVRQHGRCAIGRTQTLHWNTCRDCGKRYRSSIHSDMCASCKRGRRERDETAHESDHAQKCAVCTIRIFNDADAAFEAGLAHIFDEDENYAANGTHCPRCAPRSTENTSA